MDRLMFHTGGETKALRGEDIVLASAAVAGPCYYRCLLAPSPFQISSSCSRLAAADREKLQKKRREERGERILNVSWEKRAGAAGDRRRLLSLSHSLYMKEEASLH